MCGCGLCWPLFWALVLSTHDSSLQASRWSRFHFRRHFFQSAGIRLVSPTSSDASVQTSSPGEANKEVNKEVDKEVNKGGVNVSGKDSRGISYEDTKLLNEYLMLHYGKAKSFPHQPTSRPQAVRKFRKSFTNWSNNPVPQVLPSSVL